MVNSRVFVESGHYKVVLFYRINTCNDESTLTVTDKVMLAKLLSKLFTSWKLIRV